MPAENYKESLKEALQALVKANEIIFDSLINLETQGELKEWNSSVPDGEVHQFDFEIFRNSGDLNVQLLVKVLENIGEAYQSLLNINGLEMDGDED